ncbi:MAG: NAD(P)H-hydrate dehydratase [Chloroflexota bacterium]|nr:NAD(P)H-hydrate dehydratase [Chloroflexota bacterium]
MLTPQWVAGRLPQRPLDAHKGSFGRLLVVAGSRNYVGAAVLAAGGAYRAGAGLVTIATPESIYPIVAGSALEATHLPLPESSPGQVAVVAADLVREHAPQYEALVVGCGMGQSAETRAFLERLLLADPPLDKPVILDADALNNLAQIARWHERLRCRAVLTPHPGEMARLTGLSAGDIQSKRWETAQEWARRWGQVVVLKGAFTVVASPAEGLAVSPFANPALASAGTGDVLAGAIGGLLTQGLSPFEAACCGVYLHAAAGERVRVQVGDSGLLASDLLPWIAQAARALRSGMAASGPGADW